MSESLEKQDIVDMLNSAFMLLESAASTLRRLAARIDDDEVRIIIEDRNARVARELREAGFK